MGFMVGSCSFSQGFWFFYLLGREFATLCYAVSVCLSVFLIVSSSVRLFFCLFVSLAEINVRLERTSLICFVGLFCCCLSLELMCFNHTYLRCLEV